jgi:hypothetical protein
MTNKANGVESDTYVVPNDLTINVISSLLMCFELVPKHWILQHIKCSRVDHMTLAKGLFFGFGVQQNYANLKHVYIEEIQWERRR